MQHYRLHVRGVPMVSTPLTSQRLLRRLRGMAQQWVWVAGTLKSSTGSWQLPS